ncbi:putative ribonuclease h protein [Fagus crenata]
MEYDFSELSREEETELHRSKKKVKENSNIGSVGAHGDRSYKDKLLGEIPGAFAQAFKFSDVVEAAEDSDEEIEEISEGMASVRLSKETKLLIRSKWATALIVKPVVYEGLNLLCFVCGRLGHRKTNCPYSVRASVPESCPDAPSGVNGGKDSALVREEGSQHGPSEEEYGPWVLVTRKRSSPKVGSKRVDGTSFNASRSQDFYPVDNTIKLRSRTHGTVDASIIRGSPNGKRKTRNMSRSSSPRDQCPPDTSSGLGLNKASMLSNTLSLAFSFAAGENNFISSSDHGKRIPTSRGRRNSSVGNQSTGKANHRFTCGVRPDQGKSHCDLGIVRSRDTKGLEIYLPVNPGEQSQPVSSPHRPGLGGMEQSMVEISNRCSTGGGEQDPLLEDAARNFKGANLVRIGSLRRDFRKKDASGEADCRELHGKCGPQKIDPGVPAKLSVQDCNLSTGVEDGHFRACGVSDTGDESLSDANEGDGMEFIGVDEVSAPN